METKSLRVSRSQLSQRCLALPPQPQVLVLAPMLVQVRVVVLASLSRLRHQLCRKVVESAPWRWIVRGRLK
jgi:hypothetical protein